MSYPIAAIILIAALITACISGIFGMAGGMIFMGVIASLLGVSEAMIVHGAVQSVSNSHRAFLLKRNICWDILGRILIGALPAIAIFSWLAILPSKAILFLAMGCLPFLLWLPKAWFHFDAQKTGHAIFCGFLVIALNLTAGVAGPALDFFFVRTRLTRQQIVATKAVTMFAAHIVKIIYFGLALIAMNGISSLPPIWLFIAAVPCVMIGTFTGTRILAKMSDIGFRKYTKWLVTVIGCIYIWRGLSLMGLT